MALLHMAYKALKQTVLHDIKKSRKFIRMWKSIEFYLLHNEIPQISSHKGIFTRFHLRFFFKAPHQTTEYFNLMDRFWGNTKFFEDLID